MYDSLNNCPQHSSFGITQTIETTLPKSLISLAITLQSLHLFAVTPVHKESDKCWQVPTTTTTSVKVVRSPHPHPSTHPPTFIASGPPVPLCIFPQCVQVNAWILSYFIAITNVNYRILHPNFANLIKMQNTSCTPPIYWHREIQGCVHIKVTTKLSEDASSYYIRPELTCVRL